MNVIVIIPAAGLGTRMSAASGSRVVPSASKQFTELDGAPILIHTLRKFAAVPQVREIYVALRPSEAAGFQPRLEQAKLGKPVRVVEGGNSRQESVANALASLAADTLIEGFQAGRLDAEFLARYESRWEAELGADLRVSSWLRQFLTRCRDAEIDGLVRLTGTAAPGDIVRARVTGAGWAAPRGEPRGPGEAQVLHGGLVDLFERAVALAGVVAGICGPLIPKRLEDLGGIEAALSEHQTGGEQ